MSKNHPVGQYKLNPVDVIEQRESQYNVVKGESCIGN